MLSGGEAKSLMVQIFSSLERAAAYFKDRDSRFVMVSGSMARKFGFRSPEEMSGKSDADIFGTGQHARAALEDEREIMRTGCGIYDKLEREDWPDGRVTWVRTTKIPFVGKSGKAEGLIGFSTDVTAEVEVRREMERLNRDLGREVERRTRQANDAFRKLDESCRRKMQFLSLAGHELRTPMTGIRGYASMLLDGDFGPVPDKFRKPLENVLNGATRLVALVNDMLDLARMEAGRMEFRSEVFDVSELVREAAEGHLADPLVRGKKLKFVLRPPRNPAPAEADPSRFRQVLENLLGNAFKFTPDGGTVAVKWWKKEGRVHVEVSDTGVGIRREDRKKVFERFTLAGSETREKAGGTGLGLSIVNELVTRMGGRVTLASEPGRGARFRFTVPAKGCRKWDIPESLPSGASCALPAKFPPAGNPARGPRVKDKKTRR